MRGICVVALFICAFSLWVVAPINAQGAPATNEKAEEDSENVSDPLSSNTGDHASTDKMDSASIPFDCARPSLYVLCLNNGTCSPDDGECACINGYEGKDCYYQAERVSAECEACLHGGTCLTGDDDATSCVCTAAYHGDRCQHKRVHHECAHDSMTMFLTPPDQFMGAVYVLDQEDYPECVFDSDEDGTFQKAIKFEACGPSDENVLDTGDTTRSLNVILQFDSMMVTEKDLQFEFVCTIPKSGSDVDKSIEPFGFNKEERPFKKQKVTEDLDPVLLTVTSVDGAPVSGPQIIGTPLKLTFTLNGGEVYDSFWIDRLTATNGQSDAKEQSVDLVRNGCVPKRAFAVTDFSGDSATGASLTFKVFKLRYSDSLHFKTTVKLCKGDGCNATDCTIESESRSAIPDGLGRRKRDVDNTGGEGGEEVVYRAQLKVIYPPQWLQHGGDGNVLVVSQEDDSDVTFSDCIENNFFVLCIAVVATLVMFLACVTIFLCIHRCYKQNHGDVEFSDFRKR